MAVADNLKRQRAALTMIHAQPFNAEAPPEALEGDITPTALHYVRSNFPVPEHDGTLEIAGAVENPLTLTLDDLRALPPVERVVTLECAGNGRLAMRPLPAGEPWGDYAVSTARWKGALLHEILKRAKPHPTGVEVRFAGTDHGSYILNPVLKNIDASDLSFERSLTLVHAADPSAEILIAYEMNEEPLNPDHGSPFRLIVPHWYGVASVKWLKHIEILTTPFHGEFETGHYMYQWNDRLGRARDGHATAGTDNRPQPGRHRAPRWHIRRSRQGVVGHRPCHQRRPEPNRGGRVATGARRDPERSVPVAELVVRMATGRTRPKDAARTSNRRGRKRPARSSDLEPARLRQQRDRSRLRRRSIALAASPHQSAPSTPCVRQLFYWASATVLSAADPGGPWRSGRVAARRRSAAA